MVNPRGDGPGPPRVAVVLPGGGARGAYEAGALSVLLPKLEEHGQSVSIYCGTSVGAINGAMLASTAHLGGTGQAEALVERWRGISKGEVIGRLLSPDLLVGIGSLAGEAVGVPGMRFRGLIDPKPLRRNLDSWIDWDQLHANVATDHVRAVCAIATSLSKGQPVGFVETAGKGRVEQGAEEIHYAPVELEPVHVRASAAIPGIFPPVEVPGRGRAAGHFVDGATRLNAPIRPAIDLGAERIIVISFEPLVSGAPGRVGSRKPGFADVAANVLDGLMADQIVADVGRLVAVNSFFAEDIERSSGAARAYRRARGRRPWRKIPYALVAPRERRHLARLAERVLKERYGGLRALRDLDVALMARAMGGGPSRGELLTFLFFDEQFIAALIDAGRRDARRWISRHPHFWCSDSAHDFGLGSDPDPSDIEVAQLAEWRSMRSGSRR
ncbi:MAG: patatin-like phospholipase family protein [Solirubrobacterales bacterium]|nr:patatin-like phospholipase family protein [Solirubrobacterales bacterium]MCB8971882.1 patatin-like phospholipase family protein [Thermoleophilales bacterium]MCO5326313.1 patatin-like phospholipase family protein [Solirubrobacterales bacterium]